MLAGVICGVVSWRELESLISCFPLAHTMTTHPPCHSLTANTWDALCSPAASALASTSMKICGRDCVITARLSSACLPLPFPAPTMGPHKSQLRRACSRPVNFQLTGISTVRRLRAMVLMSRQMVLNTDSSIVSSSGMAFRMGVERGGGGGPAEKGFTPGGLLVEGPEEGTP